MNDDFVTNILKMVFVTTAVFAIIAMLTAQPYRSIIYPYTCENLTKYFNISYCDDLRSPLINCVLPDNKTVCRCELGGNGKLVLSECNIVLDKVIR